MYSSAVCYRQVQLICFPNFQSVQSDSAAEAANLGWSSAHSPSKACRQLANQLAHRFESISIASGVGAAEGESVGLDDVPMPTDPDPLIAVAVNTICGRLWQGRVLLLRLPLTTLTTTTKGLTAAPACAPLALEAPLGSNKVQRVSISDCCFLPLSGGHRRRLLVLAGDDGSLGVVANPLAGERSCSVRSEHDSGVACVAPILSADSCRFATIGAAQDRRIKLWRVEPDGELASLNTWTAGGSAPLLSAACSPLGSERLATCSTDGRLQLWDLRQSGNPVIEVFSDSNAIGCYARCLDWLDDCCLATGGVDGRLRMHDLRAGGRGEALREIQLSPSAACLTKLKSCGTRVAAAAAANSSFSSSSSSAKRTGVSVVDFLETVSFYQQDDKIVNRHQCLPSLSTNITDSADRAVNSLAWIDDQWLVSSRGRSLMLSFLKRQHEGEEESADAAADWPAASVSVPHQMYT